MNFNIISKKYGSFIIKIDKKDLNKISQYNWHVYYNKKCNRYDIMSRKNNKTHILCRIIMNAKKGQVVDHINHDTLDNRKCNLRICTCQQNMFNMKKPITNTSGAKGVSWRDDIKKYRARIKKDGKFIHLGYFDNLNEAKISYIKKAKELFGEFACFN